MKYRTARQWFDKFPKPYGDMAKRYLDNSRSAADYPSASMALSCSFVWKDTEEGWEFWEGIHDNIHAVNNFL